MHCNKKGEKRKKKKRTHWSLRRENAKGPSLSSRLPLVTGPVLHPHRATWKRKTGRTCLPLATVSRLSLLPPRGIAAKNPDSSYPRPASTGRDSDATRGRDQGLDAGHPIQHPGIRPFRLSLLRCDCLLNWGSGRDRTQNKRKSSIYNSITPRTHWRFPTLFLPCVWGTTSSAL